MRAPSLLFWRQYLRRPLGIGAIAPSSPRLARAMVRALGARPADTVVELGPGTGVFTRQLLHDGVSRDRLILIEFDRDFVGYLRKAFPGVTVIEGDARRLGDILRGLDRDQVPRILSGLPLRSMAPEMRAAIARAMAQALEPGGTLIQFTYFNAPPLPTMVPELKVQRAGVVFGNIPPAFIWRYVKDGGAGEAAVA
jgi:phosphatidylethanolamine/phosphatidyl-N-methylethanolamine N-methyltransferase